MNKLVFNRYWITDRSGIGHGKWKYFVGDFENDKSYAKEHILETLETWAQWPESYSLEIELDVEPSKEFLETELKVYEDLQAYYNKAAAEIRQRLFLIN